MAMRAFLTAICETLEHDDRERQLLQHGAECRAHDAAPIENGRRAVLALWAVGGLAIAGGRGLLKLIPLAWISRIAAVIMLALAGVSLAAALS